MVSFFLYTVLPVLLAFLLAVRVFFYFRYGNKGSENTGKNISPGNIEAELTKPINYEAPKPLKERINRVWFRASFIIIPFGVLVWGVMSYEVFDHFSRTGQVFFPAIISALFLLPVSVMCLILYVVIMVFMMIFCRK